MVRRGTKFSTVCEDLHGLLAPYKKDNTYFKVLVDQDERLSMLQVCENPIFLQNIHDEEVENFREMKRIELNIDKMTVNYIAPVHLIHYFGETMGINIAPNLVMVDNRLNLENSNYLIIRSSIKYLPDIIIAVHRMVYMSPQMKYEVISDFLKKHK